MAWSRPLSGFATEVERDQNKRLRGFALQALSGVIERSPVDTGAFRGNNIVSVGSADNSVDPNAADPSGTQALNEGMRIIGQVNDAFGVIYIQNNLPYAEKLEAGTSSQAPGGIYAVTLNNLNEAGR